MKVGCPIDIPCVTTAKTPKERIGLENAHKFKAYIEEGLKSESLPTHNGALNRTETAKENSFGRSSFTTNCYIKSVADWAEKFLPGFKAKHKSKGKKRSAEYESEVERENERLRKRNAELKAALDQYKALESEDSYKYSALYSGDEKLPW
jgi:hypothetical protein